ncbi:MmcQ/YjbR family DNA-binding protein [Aestuariibacter halophilus]|uniref:MmcQ/YjbR family DNA-binding protein n=1 Tax=Fluctibacter halophilus TaxID=226011 RepID=A0ABS8G5J5_9ALTE|nr:MmcQ/YjbR family DNA-binding protein [Aestuariibacter halophilus]MCC2615790.1 MmcQ/YjbR family DNA-binding protein [Aestuariibacter halophilus]
MPISSVLDYLLSKPDSEQCYPFGPDVAVFKVGGKMFATLSSDKDGQASVNLKCEPHQALLLRELFRAVVPGYHMNKKHWNTVTIDGSVPAGEVQRMIDHSYALVVSSLKVADRKRLVSVYGEEQLGLDKL